MEITNYDELRALQAVCSDWRERNIKRSSLPAGTTVREMIHRLETCERIVHAVDEELGQEVPVTE